MKNHIKILRGERGISQGQLAEMLGVSRQTIVSIENRRYNPSLPLAIQIARCVDKIVENVFLLDEKEHE